MPAVKVEIGGLRELERKLKQLETSVRKRIVSEALRGAAEIVREEASRRAPRRTGTLAKSITLGQVKVEKDGASVDVGPDKTGWYGRFVEMGTVKMAARPYLRPAAEENRERVQAEFVRAVREAIQEVRE